MTIAEGIVWVTVAGLITCLWIDAALWILKRKAK